MGTNLEYAHIPPAIAKLKDEDLQSLANFNGNPMISIINGIIEDEVERVKLEVLHAMPSDNARTDEFVRGMRKGRYQGLQFLLGIPGFASLEIKRRKEINATENLQKK